MQFLVFLSKCYSRYPTKHLFIESYKNIEGYSILLHLDNAPGDNSRLSSEMIESTKAQRVTHPFYNPNQTRPDLTPSDFFLFGYLKESIAGHRSLRAMI
jgi:hypothetical protein